MRQLVFLAAGRVEWQDATDPSIVEETDALVRPIAVATCDLDTVLVAGLAPWVGPFPIGHEGVAEVVEVGPSVVSCRPGDLVIVPFEINCGQCERCRRGLTASCSVAGAGSMYGLEPFGGPWGGFLADLVRVPWANAMLVRLPAGVDPVAVASMSDNIPDGWRTVAPYLADPDSASVLIVGNGGGPSIPFYSIAVARALGVAQLDYVDRDPERLAKAERLGANPIEGPAGKRAGSYSITVAASTDPASLVYALRSTAPGGTCTSNGFVGEEVALPLLEMYTRGVTLVTGRVDARAVIPHALELVVQGRLHPEDVTDAVVDWDDAPQALVEHPVKMVFRRTP